MSKIEIRKETRLETADMENICPILDYKLEKTSPEEVVDYVALAVGNLEDQLVRVKDAEANLKQLKKDISSQIDTIKIGGAKWLSDIGIDKLNGLHTSSMTIYSPKPSVDVKVTDEESVVNAGYFKTAVDKTSVKEALNNDIAIDGAELVITHKESQLKINRVRKKIA